MNNSKKNNLVISAQDLFMKYGIKRVSIEEICKEANVSKVTFYKFFKNKEKIALYIVQTIVKNNMTEYTAIMESDKTFHEKATETIKLKERIIKKFSPEFIKDIFCGKFPEVTEYLTKARKENLELLLRDYKIAQDNGDIRKDINLNFIPYILDKMTEMSNDENLINIYNSTHSMVTELLNFFFYGILTEKK